MRAALLACALMLPVLAGAQEAGVSVSTPEVSVSTPAVSVSTPAAAAAPAAPAGPTGWVKRAGSLLLYDSSSNIINEVPLGSSEHNLGDQLKDHDVLGEAAKSGRFAWVFDRTSVFDSSHVRKLSSTRTLTFYGDTGEPIWTSSTADAPKDGVPVLMSDSGEMLLVASLDSDGWTVKAEGYLGDTIMTVGPMPQFDSMDLTPNGSFAVVRWRVPDQSATHTFLNLSTRTRHDVASGTLFLGNATLSPDGKAVSGGKTVLDLSQDKPAQ